MFGIAWLPTRKQAGHTSKAAILQVDASRSESKERVFVGELRFCAQCSIEDLQLQPMCLVPIFPQYHMLYGVP